MYEQVLFYNHFGAGDIFESREFVQAWMDLVPARSYHYSHGKNPRILKDMKGLQFKPITEHMQPMRGVWDDLNGNLYVNTWIGRDGKYILPGIGCTVEKLFQMHNDMLSVYKLGTLPGQPIDYIPLVNYYEYDLIECDKFKHSMSGIRKVFIDNGLVQSRQAENFEFNPIVEQVASNHPEIEFIVTHAFYTKISNIHFTSEITKVAKFDLNEVAYLSLCCDVLIGRNSGPHVFTQNRTNCSSADKKLLSFTYHPQGASFVVNTPVEIKKLWSAATKKDEVITVIEEAL